MGQTRNIRPYQPGDDLTLTSLLSESEPWVTLGYASEDWARLWALVEAGAPRESYVVEVEGGHAGLAVLRRQFLFGDYLELLAVSPDHRGRGLGRLLLNHVEEKVFARAKNFFACVSDFNLDARRFYRQAGYSEIGRLTNLLVEGHDEILLRKTIGPTRQ